jgi:hypothetical protein
MRAAHVDLLGPVWDAAAPPDDALGRIRQRTVDRGGPRLAGRKPGRQAGLAPEVDDLQHSPGRLPARKRGSSAQPRRLLEGGCSATEQHTHLTTTGVEGAGQTMSGDIDGPLLRSSIRCFLVSARQPIRNWSALRALVVPGTRGVARVPWARPLCAGASAELHFAEVNGDHEHVQDGLSVGAPRVGASLRRQSDPVDAHML